MAEKGAEAHLPEGYCLWEMEETEFRVGLLGTGPGFLSILDIMCNPAMAEFLPPMALVAVAEPGSEVKKLLDPRVSGVPVYPSYAEMLAGIRTSTCSSSFPASASGSSRSWPSCPTM